MPCERGLLDLRTVVTTAAARAAHHQRNGIREGTRLLELGAVGAEPGFERKLVAALGQVGRNVEHQSFGIVNSQQRDGGGHALVGGVDQREQAQPRAVGIDTAYLRACDVEDAAGGDGSVGLAPIFL